MLNAIFSQISSFFGVIVTGIKFTISFFADQIKIIATLKDVITVLPSYYSFLPSVLLAAVGTCFTVLLILRVVGRD